MKLVIVSPTSKKELDVKWVEVNSAQGNFIIEPGHASLIARLEPGKELTASRDDDTVERFVVADGVLKVHNDIVTVVLTQ